MRARLGGFQQGLWRHAQISCWANLPSIVSEPGMPMQLAGWPASERSSNIVALNREALR